MSSSDLDNFTAFLKELRAEPAAHGLLISAAVSVTPYLGSDGKPSTNLSDFAAVLDHIAIMNYDINVGLQRFNKGPSLMIHSTGSMVQHCRSQRSFGRLLYKF